MSTETNITADKLAEQAERLEHGSPLKVAAAMSDVALAEQLERIASIFNPKHMNCSALIVAADRLRYPDD